MAAASPFQGLPQSTRPCLTAGGGAKQPSLWLARPRHHMRLRSAARDACLPLASSALTALTSRRPAPAEPAHCLFSRRRSARSRVRCGHAFWHGPAGSSLHLPLARAPRCRVHSRASEDHLVRQQQCRAAGRAVGASPTAQYQRRVQPLVADRQVIRRRARHRA